MEANVRSRKIYLPKGINWKDAYTGKVYTGGTYYEVPAPLDIIPVFVKEGCEIQFL